MLLAAVSKVEWSPFVDVLLVILLTLLMEYVTNHVQQDSTMIPIREVVSLVQVVLHVALTTETSLAFVDVHLANPLIKSTNFVTPTVQLTSTMIHNQDLVSVAFHGHQCVLRQ